MNARGMVKLLRRVGEENTAPNILYNSQEHPRTSFEADVMTLSFSNSIPAYRESLRKHDSQDSDIGISPPVDRIIALI
jgi:hypothetical protein